MHILYIDQTSGFALAAKFRFMSCQDYAEIYTNHNTMKGKWECVSRGVYVFHSILTSRCKMVTNLSGKKNY